MARATSLMLATMLLLLPLFASAQFGFFEQMFSGGGHYEEHDHREQRQQENNVPSDAKWFVKNYEQARCSGHLCNTLACVDKPSDCPCAFSDVEEKFILHSTGLSICLSPSGGGRGMYTKEKVDKARRGEL